MDDYLARIEREQLEIAKVVPDLYAKLEWTNEKGVLSTPTTHYVYQSKQNTIPASAENPRAVAINDNTIASFSSLTPKRIEAIQFETRRGFNWGSLIASDQNRIEAHNRPAECLKCHGVQVPLQDKNGQLHFIQVFRPLMGSGQHWPGWYGSSPEDEMVAAESAKFEDAKNRITGPAKIRTGKTPYFQWFDNGNLNDHLHRFMSQIWFQILVSHPGFMPFRAALSTLLLVTRTSGTVDAVIARLPPDHSIAEWRAKYKSAKERITGENIQFLEHLVKELAASQSLEPKVPSSEQLTEAAKNPNVIAQTESLALLAIIAEPLGMDVRHMSSDFHPSAIVGKDFTDEFLFALTQVFPETGNYFPASYGKTGVAYLPENMKMEHVDRFLKTELKIYQPLTLENMHHLDGRTTGTTPTGKCAAKLRHP